MLRLPKLTSAIKATLDFDGMFSFFCFVRWVEEGEWWITTWAKHSITDKPQTLYQMNVVMKLVEIRCTMSNI